MARHARARRGRALDFLSRESALRPFVRRALRDLRPDLRGGSLCRRLRGGCHSRGEAIPETNRRGEGRVLRAAALGAPRSPAHDPRTRPAGRVHRTRDPVALVLRPRVFLPDDPRLLGGRAEVLPDRRLRLCFHGLRDRHSLRQVRKRPDRGARAAGPRDGSPRPLRTAAHPGRLRFQDVARPVPRLGARRLPGDADARRGVPLGSAERRERDRPLPGPGRDVRGRDAGQVPHRDRGARDPLDEPGQRGRSRAARYQAPAGVLGYRPHGLRDDCARGVRTRRARRRDRLLLRLRRLERGCFRGGRGALPGRDQAAPGRAARGRGTPLAVRVRGPRALPVLARRDPGHGRLHRQILRIQGRHRAGALRPRRHRRSQQPGVDWVLPEGRLRPLHARPGRRDRPRAPRAGGSPRPGAVRGRHPGPRHLPVGRLEPGAAGRRGLPFGR